MQSQSQQALPVFWILLCSIQFGKLPSVIKGLSLQLFKGLFLVWILNLIFRLYVKYNLHWNNCQQILIRIFIWHNLDKNAIRLFFMLWGLSVYRFIHFMLCSPSENKFIQPLTLILLSRSSVYMSPRVMTVSQNISFFFILFSSLWQSCNFP